MSSQVGLPNDHLSEKDLFIRFTVCVLRKLLSILSFWFRGRDMGSGLEIVKRFHAQLCMKFVQLINVKMPTFI